jgi:hypothetical protein
MVDVTQVSTVEWIAAGLIAAAIVVGVYIGVRQARAFWTEAGDRSLITALLSFSPAIISQMFRHH